MPRKARVQTSTNVYHAYCLGATNSSQTHGIRYTKHTWTTANLRNIQNINVVSLWHADWCDPTQSGPGTCPSDP